jgi:hypothetical protein
MICAVCKDPIPFFDEHVVVKVVYEDGRVNVHCQHRPFDESDPAIIAVIGSQDCYDRFLDELINQIMETASQN